MKKSLLAGRLLAGFIAIYHIVTGVILMSSGEMAIRAAKTLAGLTITGSPELGILGEILACYVIAFGFMMALAAWDPVKNRSLLTVGLVLFALRVIQRVAFSTKVIEVFQADPARYWMAAGIVVLLAVGLLAFRLQVRKEMV